MVLHGDQDESLACAGSSIIAHRPEITNPSVFYMTAFSHVAPRSAEPHHPDAVSA